jgi:hypothetical protein
MKDALLSSNGLSLYVDAIRGAIGSPDRSIFLWMSFPPSSLHISFYLVDQLMLV